MLNCFLHIEKCNKNYDSKYSRNSEIDLSAKFAALNKEISTTKHQLSNERNIIFLDLKHFKTARMCQISFA